MPSDRYTKFVLTIAALALTVIALRPMLAAEPADARAAADEIELLASIDASLAEIAEDTALLAAIGTNVADISEDTALIERIAADVATLNQTALGVAKADFPCTNRLICGGPQ